MFVLGVMAQVNISYILNVEGGKTCELIQEVVTKEFPNRSFQLLEICGADHAYKYKCWRRRTMVCLGRPGFTQLVKKEMLEDGSDFDNFMLLEEDLEDISSTNIRNRVEKQDYEGLISSGFVDTAVVEHLKKEAARIYLP
jgi:nicotinic acid mononucleotide adenylyltransferase